MLLLNMEATAFGMVNLVFRKRASRIMSLDHFDLKCSRSKTVMYRIETGLLDKAGNGIREDMEYVFSIKPKRSGVQVSVLLGAM